MSGLAIFLILTSAILHAVWNYVAKRAVTSGAILVFIFAALETIFLIPLAFVLLYGQDVTVSWIAIVFIIGSGFLHAIYFVLLTTGYRVGDLSIVYPIARGTGPLFASIGAIMLLAEEPSVLVLGGTVVISVGVIILTGDPRKVSKSAAMPAITFGLLTGLAVASYTLWDAYAMNRLLIAPILFQAGISSTRMLLLLPNALMKWEDVKQAWHYDKYKAMLVAVFSSMAYMLILVALQFSDVSYVAPMRTISILIGVLIGANLLKEKQAIRRLIAAATMVIGLILLNLG